MVFTKVKEKAVISEVALQLMHTNIYLHPTETLHVCAAQSGPPSIAQLQSNMASQNATHWPGISPHHLISPIWNDDAIPHSYNVHVYKSPCFYTVYNFSNVHGLHQGITHTHTYNMWLS